MIEPCCETPAFVCASCGDDHECVIDPDRLERAIVAAHPDGAADHPGPGCAHAIAKAYREDTNVGSMVRHTPAEVYGRCAVEGPHPKSECAMFAKAYREDTDA